MTTVGDLKKILADLPDETILAEQGHSGNMLYQAEAPFTLVVDQAFKNLNPDRDWCKFPIGATVLVIATQEG